MNPTAEQSDRAVARAASAQLRPEALRTLADLIDLKVPVRVVDIGANPLEDTPPYLPLLRAGLAQVTGFEPQPDALARLAEAAGPRECYLPDALGDGGEHTLRICASPGFSSLLEPDPRQLAVLTDFPRLAAVTTHSRVQTTRLDDVPDLGQVDLLTLDAQGSEPSILHHGRRALEGVLAVQVEAPFHRLYEGGPTLAHTDARLRDLGLVPHAVVSTRTWPLAPIPWADPLEATARHLVEADLLYVLDPAGWTELGDGRLRALVLVLAGAYGRFGAGLIPLRELVRRGAVPADAEGAYRELVADPRPA